MRVLDGDVGVRGPIAFSSLPLFPPPHGLHATLEGDRDARRRSKMDCVVTTAAEKYICQRLATVRRKGGQRFTDGNRKRLLAKALERNARNGKQ